MAPTIETGGFSFGAPIVIDWGWHAKRVARDSSHGKGLRTDRGAQFASALRLTGNRQHFHDFDRVAGKNAEMRVF
jgi:hypothetical protein